ncbi:hypothetical protein QA601_10290 [Chitinispirillales bacterium ANBcel5]|uniref:hypothetical protein n=1 Tax=Cellulosispirillum alkaliphilum TaxID=3039283 RepID=UPI002A549243|nr:hypothetical protein [Chitinispirillales bacterium ANBcel5]
MIGKYLLKNSFIFLIFFGLSTSEVATFPVNLTNADDTIEEIIRVIFIREYKQVSKTGVKDATKVESIELYPDTEIAENLC